jgi:hypothetical protein
VQLNWESGGCETGALKKETDFQPATILRRIFTRINCEIGGFHPVEFIWAIYLGFRLFVRYGLVAVW